VGRPSNSDGESAARIPQTQLAPKDTKDLGTLKSLRPCARAEESQARWDDSKQGKGFKASGATEAP
jgi:hypothetical protein